MITFSKEQKLEAYRRADPARQYAAFSIRVANSIINATNKNGITGKEAKEIRYLIGSYIVNLISLQDLVSNIDNQNLKNDIRSSVIPTIDRVIRDYKDEDDPENDPEKDLELVEEGTVEKKEIPKTIIPEKIPEKVEIKTEIQQVAKPSTPSIKIPPIRTPYMEASQIPKEINREEIIKEIEDKEEKELPVPVKRENVLAFDKKLTQPTFEQKEQKDIHISDPYREPVE